MSRQPEVLWAQRSDKVYLTVSLPDAKNVHVESEPQGVVSFSAMGAQEETFAFRLELYGGIVPEGGKVNIGLRNIIVMIKKDNKVWWKRLLKSEEKPAPYIKVDWNKWCDEDEEGFEYDSFNFNDDENRDEEGDSSDDDDGLLYLPDLEKARGK